MKLRDEAEAKVAALQITFELVETQKNVEFCEIRAVRQRQFRAPT